MRNSLKPFALLFTIGLLLFPVLAGTTGRINGVIKDSAGSVMAGVQVTVTNTATGIKSQAKSDKKGSYSFPLLTAGRYDFHAESQGFKPDERHLVVHVDDAIRIDVVLEPTAKAEGDRTTLSLRSGL